MLPHKLKNISKIQIAAIIIENLDRQILLMQRDDKPTLSYSGYWALIGGHVEEGEEIDGALKREIKEEVNIEIRDFKFIGVIKELNKDIYVYHKRSGYHIDDFKLGEGQALRFFDIKDLKNLKLIPYQKRFLLNKLSVS